MMTPQQKNMREFLISDFQKALATGIEIKSLTQPDLWPEKLDGQFLHFDSEKEKGFNVRKVFTKKHGPFWGEFAEEMVGALTQHIPAEHILSFKMRMNVRTRTPTSSKYIGGHLDSGLPNEYIAAVGFPLSTDYDHGAVAPWAHMAIWKGDQFAHESPKNNLTKEEWAAQLAKWPGAKERLLLPNGSIRRFFCAINTLVAPEWVRAEKMAAHKEFSLI